MKIRENTDQEVVKTIREGLARTGGYCPCKIERTDEFFRQMHEAMLANKPIVSGTANKCPALSYDCIKLQEFRAKQK
mgnify:CR=1 FL=1